MEARFARVGLIRSQQNFGVSICLERQGLLAIVRELERQCRRGERDGTGPVSGPVLRDASSRQMLWLRQLFGLDRYGRFGVRRSG